MISSYSDATSPVWTAANAHKAIWRFMALAVLLGSLASQFSSQLVQALLPLFAVELGWIDSNYRIDDLQVMTTATEHVVSMDVGIAQDFDLGADHIVADPRAHANASTLVGYVGLSTVLLVAMVLAWPARNGRAWVVRVIGLIAALVLLWSLDTPPSLMASIWNIHVALHDPGRFSPLLIWAGFLQNGGRVVLPIALALLIIGTSESRHAAQGRAPL